MGVHVRRKTPQIDGRGRPSKTAFAPERRMLSPHAWITIGTILGVFVILQVRRRVPTDLLFLSALAFVTLCGVISPEEALSGFSNNAVVTIAGLFVCAASLRATGGLDWIGRSLLGSVQKEKPALVRLSIVLVAASSFVLNSALVAMTMPVVIDWCRKRGISPSRLLMPVSYLAILGGVCTLVGTSTTLVVNQQLASAASLVEGNVAPTFLADLRPMGLFEIGKVGAPCALLGTFVLFFISSRLLPRRREIATQVGEEAREYLVELLVQPECPLIDKNVTDAGLRQLPGLFLIEINRPNQVITPVTPRNIIRNGDRLVFSGIVETIVDLEKIPGLVPTADLNYDVAPASRRNRQLVEVVLSRACPLLGTTVREGGFRQKYNAAIIAVHRNGSRLTNKIGDIVLEPGDTLLLQTPGKFAQNYRNSRDFYLVSDVDGAPRRHDRALLAGLLAFILIVWLCCTNFLATDGVWSGFSSTAMAAVTIAVLMILTRCLPVSDARTAVNLPLIMTIAGALGLALALDRSGADDAIASGIVSVVGLNPMTLLVVVYLLSVLATEMISNTAVAALMLPLAVQIASMAGVSPRPYIMAITLAASLSFLSPIGYQTNLMVMGPGGYRPSDYFKVGLPIAITVAATAMVLIPVIWPFEL